MLAVAYADRAVYIQVRYRCRRSSRDLSPLLSDGDDDDDGGDFLLHRRQHGNYYFGELLLLLLLNVYSALELLMLRTSCALASATRIRIGDADAGVSFCYY